MNYNNDYMDLEPPPPGLQPFWRQQMPPQAQQPPQQRVKLQPFWSSSPEEWFALAEAQFELNHVYAERARFMNVLGSLPEQVVRSVNDLLRGPAPPDAYTQLKARLLAAHGLTEFQRMEKLVSSQGLGGQKPSELLASMLQLCPAGEGNTRLFRFLYLQRLPRELRILLSEDAASPLHALAARADILWSHNSSRGSGILAAAVSAADAEEEPGQVAAVRGGGARGGRGGRSGRGGKKNNRGNQRGQPDASGGGGAVQDGQAPVDFARAGSGLCHAHFVYGNKAFPDRCVQPCNWQGN
jgi:hypothetical protein